MYIIGSTESGRTYGIWKILEEKLIREFKYIFLICPTFDKTYQEWKCKDDPKFFVLKVSQDDVESWLGIIEENYQNTNLLVILDDCASCQSVKNRTSNLVSFAYHGRHAGFSTIVLSQQFTAITPAFRLNADHILVFYMLDESDWKSICKNFSTRMTKKTEK